MICTHIASHSHTPTPLGWRGAVTVLLRSRFTQNLLVSFWYKQIYFGLICSVVVSHCVVRNVFLFGHFLQRLRDRVSVLHTCDQSPKNTFPQITPFTRFSMQICLNTKLCVVSAHQNYHCTFCHSFFICVVHVCHSASVPSPVPTLNRLFISWSCN